MAITHAFVLNPTVRQSDGQQMVLLRITSQRVHRYVETGVLVKAAQFNPKATAQKANWIRAINPNADLYNATLKSLNDRLDRLVQRLKQMGGEYTAQQVKDRLKERAEESFSAFIENRIAAWQVGGQDDNARNHGTVVKRLREFLYNYSEPRRATNAPALPDPKRPPVQLAQLTPETVAEFEVWLTSRPLRTSRSTSATRRNYATDILRRLRQNITAYIAKHRLPSEADPTRGMTFHTVNTDPVWLSQPELMIWEQARLNTGPLQREGNRGSIQKGRDSLEAARVVYLASYYLHGIRAGDVLSLRVGQIEEGRWEMIDGSIQQVTRLFYTSDKKDKKKSVLIEPFVLQMLRPYLTGKGPDHFLFPFLPQRLRHQPESAMGADIDKRVIYLNRLLKKVSKELGTNPNVAMHSARRTFADDLYELTGDLRVVQDALHHSDITTTQRYVMKGKQQRVDQANKLYKQRKFGEGLSGDTPLKQNEELRGSDDAPEGRKQA